MAIIYSDTPYQAIHKFGNNLDVDSNTTPEDCWSVGGVYVFPSSAATVTVSSDDADDTSAGTGARTVQIYGLDANFEQIDETLTMNGVTGVTSSNSYLRVFRMKVITAGTTETNEGTISTVHGATTVAEIPAGKGQTLMAVYTTPANRKAYLVAWNFSAEKSRAAVLSVSLEMRTDGGAWQTKETESVNTDGAGRFNTTFPIALRVPEKTDIRLRVTSNTANDVAVHGGFDLQLVT